MNTEIIINRLALIKWLYKAGLEQSRQPEPVAAFSILSFHDSMEMFLKLLTEHLNIKSEKFAFIEYWDNIPALTLKESCRALNARRVNIKHKGLLPSKADIEASRVTTTDFFTQNTPLFGVEFDKISLLSLITYPTVKTYLEAAQVNLSKGEFEQSTNNAALAFEELLHVYESSKGQRGHSPFFFGRDLHFNSHTAGIKDRRLADFLDDVKDSLSAVSKAIKIMGFGIDYRKYTKFKALTPISTRTISGKVFLQTFGDKKLTNDNCQYCIDFVMESAIKLQDFDFEMHELLEFPQAWRTA